MNSERRLGKPRRGAMSAWFEPLMLFAVVGILAAITVAGAVSAARASRLTRLDDRAGAIFREASRSLTAVCAGGRTQTLREGVGEVSDLAGFFAENTGPGAEESGTVYYITDAMDTQARGALLGDAGLGADDRFCVIYAVDGDGERASVLEVWYTSRELEGGLPRGLGFDAITDPVSDAARARLRDPEARRAAAGGRVGRCGAVLTEPGADAVPSSVRGQPALFQCWLEIRNAEELTASLRCYVPSDGGFYDENGVTALSYTLKLLGVTSGAEKTMRSGVVAFAPDAGSAPEGASGLVFELGTVTLDSLRARGGFRSVFGPDGFVPGEDVVLELGAACAVNGGAAVPARTGEEGESAALRRVNSLFASAERKSSHWEVEIAYGRHLQNLDSALSGVDYAELPIRAVQTQDIYFHGVYDTGVYPGGRGLYADGRDEPYDEPVEQWARTYESRSFLPVENAMLRAYDGGGHMIDDLTVTFEGLTSAANAVMGVHSAAAAGLFGVFSDGELKGIELVDPVLRDGGRVYAAVRYAGGLAGRTTGAVDIADCRLRMRARLGADSGGGRLYADAVDWLTASESAGGLVGWASGPLTIEDSCAATVVESGYGGGLVGYAGDSLRVSGSYADCYIAGRYVGGLVGQYSGEAGFLSCYSAGAVLGEVAYAGRFVGRDTAAAADGACYSVFSFTDPVGGGEAVHAYTNGVPQPGRTDLGSAAAGGGYYLAGCFDAGSLNEEENLLRWPYPTFGLPHYGDWLPPETRQEPEPGTEDGGGEEILESAGISLYAQEG